MYSIQGTDVPVEAPRGAQELFLLSTTASEHIGSYAQMVAYGGRAGACPVKGIGFKKIKALTSL